MVLSIDLRDAAEEFIDSLGARGYSPFTETGYGRDLRRVFGLLAAAPGGVAPRDWTASRLEAAFGALLRGRRRATSAARALSACRCFEAYCVERGLLERTPARSVVLRRARDRAAAGPAIECFAAALEALGIGDREGLRQRAVLESLAVPGVIAADLTRLRVRDLDLAARRLTLRARTPRRVRLSPRAAQALSAHLAAAGDGAAPAAFLVTGSALRSVSLRLVHTTVRDALERVAARMRTSPEEARERFVEWCGRMGNGVEGARRAMGYLRRGPARGERAGRPRERAARDVATRVRTREVTASEGAGSHDAER